MRPLTSLTPRPTARPAARPRRGAVLVAAVGTAAVVLAACSTGTPGPASSGTGGGASRSTAASNAAPAAVVPLPPVLDQRSVSGLVPEQDSTNDPTDRRSIATVSVAGDPTLDDRLTQLADVQTADYEKGRSDGVANELNIGWDPVLAAGTTVGIRVSTRVYTGGAHSRTLTRSVYSDVSSGTTWDSDALVADPAQLAAWAGAALASSDLAGSAPAPEDTTHDLRFGRDGSITMVFDQGTVAAEAAGDVAVRVEPAATEQVLTDAGRAVRSAAIAAAPFTPPAPVPTTTAEPLTERTPTPQSPATPSSAPTTVPPVTGPTQSPPGDGDVVDCSTLKCIALTFDDGPGPYTAKLLQELASKDVRATFFLIGRSVGTRPELVKAELAAGHAVGNHTYEHLDLVKLDAATIGFQVDRTAAAILDATGVRPTLLRPPYGATNPTVKAVARERGYAQILWNVDTEDWKNRNVATTTQRALDGARPGAIILMHDIHPTTVQAVPGIIDALRARGYTLVTVPQLIGTPEAGKTYSSGRS